MSRAGAMTSTRLNVVVRAKRGGEKGVERRGIMCWEVSRINTNIIACLWDSVVILSVG